MIVAVVVEVQHPVDLALGADVDIVRVGDALAHGLPGVFLHLNVIKLPAKKEKIKLRLENCYSTVVKIYG